jgi:hypothetical protein
MRFADINGQKIGVVLVILIDLNNVANLAAERRSSKTSKDEHQRSLVSAFADVEAADAVQRYDAGIGGVAADLQGAAMHVGQGVAGHTVSVFRASGHNGKTDESHDDKRAQNASHPFHETLHIKLFQLLASIK